MFYFHYSTKTGSDAARPANDAEQVRMSIYSLSHKHVVSMFICVSLCLISIDTNISMLRPLTFSVFLSICVCVCTCTSTFI